MADHQAVTSKLNISVWTVTESRVDSGLSSPSKEKQIESCTVKKKQLYNQRPSFGGFSFFFIFFLVPKLEAIVDAEQKSIKYKKVGGKI